MALQPGAEAALALCVRVAAVGALVSTAELLHLRDHLRPGRLLGARDGWWAGSRADAVLLRVLAPVTAAGVFTWVLVVRAVAAALVVLAGGQDRVRICGVVVLLVTGVLLAVRNPFGLDGADQMSTVVFGAASLAALGGGGDATVLALWFVALQACLAYLTAGVAKAVSPRWRSGDALAGVLGTRSHGLPALGAALRRRPAAAAVLSWAVIVPECLFPLALVGDWPVLLAFLLWGVAFHVAAAAVMGLNSFVWAFVATYPAVVFVWAQVDRLPG